MIKVLMVCLGNICRSPLAEGILKSKVDKAHVFVDSAGTAGWHQGKLPDKRSIMVANQHQIDLTDQRSRKFKVTDFDTFDFIYVMDVSNYEDVVSLARDNQDIKKVSLLLDESNSQKGKEVPDPYYGGDDGFELVYQMVDKACDAIVIKLKNNNG